MRFRLGLTGFGSAQDGEVRAIRKDRCVAVQFNITLRCERLLREIHAGGAAGGGLANLDFGPDSAIAKDLREGKFKCKRADARSRPGLRVCLAQPLLCRSNVLVSTCKYHSARTVPQLTDLLRRSLDFLQSTDGRHREPSVADRRLWTSQSPSYLRE